MGVIADEVQSLSVVWDEPGFVQHPHEDLESFYEGASFYDDVTGKPLECGGVKEARRVELEFVDKRPVYEEVPIQESHDVTGRGPIDTNGSILTRVVPEAISIDHGGWQRTSTRTSPTTSTPRRHPTRRSNS